MPAPPNGLPASERPRGSAGPSNRRFASGETGRRGATVAPVGPRKRPERGSHRTRRHGGALQLASVPGEERPRTALSGVPSPRAASGGEGRPDLRGRSRRSRLSPSRWTCRRRRRPRPKPRSPCRPPRTPRGAVAGRSPRLRTGSAAARPSSAPCPSSRTWRRRWRRPAHGHAFGPGVDGDPSDDLTAPGAGAGDDRVVLVGEAELTGRPGGTTCAAPSPEGWPWGLPLLAADRPHRVTVGDGDPAGPLADLDRARHPQRLDVDHAGRVIPPSRTDPVGAGGSGAGGRGAWKVRAGYRTPSRPRTAQAHSVGSSPVRRCARPRLRRRARGAGGVVLRCPVARGLAARQWPPRRR
jgi:hypothetical protein